MRAGNDIGELAALRQAGRSGLLPWSRQPATTHRRFPAGALGIYSCFLTLRPVHRWLGLIPRGRPSWFLSLVSPERKGEKEKDQGSSLKKRAGGSSSFHSVARCDLSPFSPLPRPPSPPLLVLGHLKEPASAISPPTSLSF